MGSNYAIQKKRLDGVVGVKGKGRRHGDRRKDHDTLLEGSCRNGTLNRSLKARLLGGEIQAFYVMRKAFVLADTREQTKTIPGAGDRDLSTEKGINKVVTRSEIPTEEGEPWGKNLLPQA